MKTFPLFKVHVQTEEALANIKTVFESGFINEGVQVTELMHALSVILGSDQLILMNSCTSALTLALHLAGVGPGDEVITTPMTCVATNTPIANSRAKIVWADINPETGLIDVMSVANKITRNTRAVMAVAWAGTPPELAALQQLCQNYGIKLILDAAHAFGAWYGSVNSKAPIHACADYTCFPGTTVVYTQDGNKKIKDIKEGDLVLTASGDYKPVISHLVKKYKGEWTTFKAGQARISATSDHPVKICRNNIDDYVPIGEVAEGDYAYVRTIKCSRCSNLIPYYMSVCKTCYIHHNRSNEKRDQMRQIALSRSKLPKRQTSRMIHHEKHVSPVMEKYRIDGYRVIPMIYAFPDFLALKENKIIAVEVESGCTINERKLHKYERIGDDTYDDIVWHTVGERNEVSCKHQYEIVGSFAKVRVWNISKHHYRNRMRTVHNLTVADNPTYVAGNILVHNCYSFQAIKHFTTGDGGALVCSSKEDYRRAKSLKWFGLDRDHAKDDKGNWKGQQWDVNIVEAGYKFNMNNVCAAIGLSQVKYIDNILNAHRHNASLYKSYLGFGRSKHVVPLDSPAYAISSYWVYPMRVVDGNRDELITKLNAEGIMAGLVHVPNDTYTAFEGVKADLPGVREFARKQFNLPCGWWITPEDVLHIATRVKKLCGDL